MNPRGLILPLRIVGVLFLFMALIPGVIGVVFYRRTADFLAAAVARPGRVIDVTRSQGSQGDTMYHFEFEYQDLSGQTARRVSSWASNPPAYSVGDPVEVLLSPSDSSDVRTWNFIPLWFATVLCAGLTVPPLVAAAIFLLLIPFAIGRIWPRPAGNEYRPADAAPPANG